MLASTLFEVVVKASAVLVLAWGTTRLFGRWLSAAARHQVWVAALIVSLLMPALVLYGPTWNIEIAGGRWAVRATLASSPSISSESLSSRVRTLRLFSIRRIFSSRVPNKDSMPRLIWTVDFIRGAVVESEGGWTSADAEAGTTSTTRIPEGGEDGCAILKSPTGQSTRGRSSVG